MSRIIDYTDRSTCVLFGDGAGAMIVEQASDDDPNAFIAFLNEIDGSGAHNLHMPAGGSRMPPSHETVEKKLHYVKQEGQQVFRSLSAKCMMSVGSCSIATALPRTTSSC